LKLVMMMKLLVLQVWYGLSASEIADPKTRDKACWRLEKIIRCYDPTKTLTMGEGGMVTTHNKDLYENGCLLRSHGDAARYHHILFGLNYRTTDIASAIGLSQLTPLDEYLEKRRKAAKILRAALEKNDAVTPQSITPNSDPSYSYFIVRLELEQLKCTHDEFITTLQAENIECGVHYPTALTQQPIVKEMLNPPPCLVSEDLSRRVLSLLMHPYLTDEDLKLIVEAVEKVTTHYHI